VAPTAFPIVMPPPISWSALADASGRVGVWGLGVEGGASLRRLRAMGHVPVLVDDRPAAPSLDGTEVLATDRGGLDALMACEVVVKSPGISRYRPEVAELEGAGVSLCGGLGLFMADADPERVVCVTGTKGKSTTTVLAVHLLRALGVHADAGGNIGRPPWDLSDEADPDYWVIETSSFQVPDLPVASRVVVVTSLAPDHLDWHGTVERYYGDKLSLCTKPGVELALANGSDDRLRAQASLMGTHVRWITDAETDRDAVWSSELGLRGRHNARNATLARQILLALEVPGAGDDRRLRAAAVGFEGLPSRCRSVGTVGPVEFVDDSLSTNVLPTEAALDAFEHLPVALLVGGHDRGVDYAPLGRALAKRAGPTLVVTMPDNGPRIGAAIRTASTTTEVVDAASLGEAVATAYRWALEAVPRRHGDERDGESGGGAVVLLSPAAPSFGRFRDYRARARAFTEAAANCGRLEGGG
jgi:UDP-N-acetylmuramoyl-L-alanine---L-glutamate ligase